jgi:fatty acid desaturase
MVHLPHHVDIRIPCYRLLEAARAIAAEFPDDVEQGCWLGYAYVP